MSVQKVFVVRQVTNLRKFGKRGCFPVIVGTVLWPLWQKKCLLIESRPWFAMVPLATTYMSRLKVGAKKILRMNLSCSILSYIRGKLRSWTWKTI